MKGYMKFAMGVIAGCAIGSLVTVKIVQGQGGGPSTLEGQLSHISFAVSDVDKTAKAFGDVFGVKVPPSQVFRDIPWGPAFPGKKMNGKLASLQINKVSFEFLQPLDGESPWKDYIKKSGDGIHHVGFGVKDVAAVNAARDYLVSKGGVQTQEFADWASYVDMHKAGLPVTFEITCPPPPGWKPPTQPAQK